MLLQPNFLINNGRGTLSGHSILLEPVRRLLGTLIRVHEDVLAVFKRVHRYTFRRNTIPAHRRLFSLGREEGSTTMLMVNFGKIRYPYFSFGEERWTHYERQIEEREQERAKLNETKVVIDGEKGEEEEVGSDGLREGNSQSDVGSTSGSQNNDESDIHQPGVEQESPKEPEYLPTLTTWNLSLLQKLPPKSLSLFQTREQLLSY